MRRALACSLAVERVDAVAPTPARHWRHPKIVSADNADAEEVREMIIAGVVAYFVLLLVLLVACLLRRVGWRWLLAAATPLFVAAGVVCLGLLSVALLGRGGKDARIGTRDGRATGLPWR